MHRDYEDDTVPLVKRDSYPFGMTYAFDIILVHYDEENEIQRKAIARHEGRKYGDLILLKDGDYLIYQDYQLIKEVTLWQKVHLQNLIVFFQTQS